MISQLHDNIKILIEFKMLVDTDYGLIKLIKRDYNDTPFYKSILDFDEKHLKGALCDMESHNPLRLIAKDASDDESIDSLYEQFMSTRYKDIIDLSKITEIVELVKMLIQTNEAYISILCENALEKQIVQLIFKMCKEKSYSIILNNSDLWDVGNYDIIFIKDINTLGRLKNLSGKTVFLAKLARNLDYEKLSKNIISLKDIFLTTFCRICEIKLIDLYLYDDNYFPYPGYYDARYGNPNFKDFEKRVYGKDNIFIKTMMGDLSNVKDFRDTDDDSYNESKDKYSKENITEDIIHNIDEDYFDPAERFKKEK